MVPETCSVPECERTYKAVGFCLAHYKRFRRWGDPTIKRPTTPPSERFWAKVDKSGECWIWTAGRTAQGYGGFHPTKGTTELAHRWSYREAFGDLEPDLVIDHLCRNRQCVNPAHLEQVTNLENLSRGEGYALANGMRTTCLHGHEYTPDNTYICPKGRMRCRRCARIRDTKRGPSTARKIRRNYERQAA